MTEEELLAVARRFLDKDGKLRQLPSKRQSKNAALFYLASKFEPHREYTEKEVNVLLEEWHLFGDPCLLRRELFDAHFLDRTSNGRAYWLSQPQPTPEELL